MRTTAPPIDLLDAAFYVDGAREVYRWMRRNAPVYFDEKNRISGIATYDGVRAAGATRPSSRTRAAAVQTRDRCRG